MKNIRFSLSLFSLLCIPYLNAMHVELPDIVVCDSSENSIVSNAYLRTLLAQKIDTLSDKWLPLVINSETPIVAEHFSQFELFLKEHEAKEASVARKKYFYAVQRIAVQFAAYRSAAEQTKPLCLLLHAFISIARDEFENLQKLDKSISYLE